MRTDKKFLSVSDKPRRGLGGRPGSGEETWAVPQGRRSRRMRTRIESETEREATQWIKYTAAVNLPQWPRAGQVAASSSWRSVAAPARRSRGIIHARAISRQFADEKIEPRRTRSQKNIDLQPFFVSFTAEALLLLATDRISTESFTASCASRSKSKRRTLRASTSR